MRRENCDPKFIMLSNIEDKLNGFLQQENCRIDLHAHLHSKQAEELDLRKQNGIFTCFSAGTMEEWKKMEGLRCREELLVSFGVHPWHAEAHSVQECQEAFRNCDFIGEIGMDSVWCQVSLKRQEKILEEQLQIAANLKKPVLLHTKGEEKKIGEILQDFPGKICVHWYSGSEKWLEPYLEKDCYFTLGPNFAKVCQGRVDASEEQRQGYLRILREVPENRLFLETDGLEAVAWAFGKQEVPLEKLCEVLKENEHFISEQKNRTITELQRQMKINLKEFLA